MVAELNPTALLNTIKFLYKLDYLTFDRLKQILKEGAKFNQILRIKEENFDDLVASLNLPLEKIPEKGARDSFEMDTGVKKPQGSHLKSTLDPE